MVNLITNNINVEKTGEYHVSQPKTVQNEQQEPIKVVVKNDTFEYKGDKKTKKNLILSSSLIALGGALVFAGLKYPTEKSVYRRFVARNIVKMDLLYEKYISQLRLILNDKLLSVEKFIADFKASHSLDINAHVPAIKNQDDYKHVLSSHDFAFDSIHSYSAKQHHAGASDMCMFKSNMDKAIYYSASEISRPQKRTQLAIQDIVSVKLERNQRNFSIVDYAENQLIAMRNIVVEQLERTKNTFFRTARQSYSDKMSKAIIKSREDIYQAKENVLYATFDKFRELLKLPSDFKPRFKIIPSDDNFRILTKVQLLPNKTKMPIKLNKIFEDNIFYNIIMKNDLSTLSDTDFNSLYNRVNSDQSLRDLGYLIDRLRLHKVAREASLKRPQEQIGVAIAKLEFLSKKLHDIGEHRLYDSLQADFNKMNLSQRHAALYRVYDNARRLGYTGIEAMDKDLTNKYQNYKNLSIKAYMKIFKDNPDLYFM